jgi:hypothetical protein
VRADLVDPGMDRQLAIVRDLAATDPDQVSVLDSAEVWGAAAVADMDGDGAPDRKPDLVHVCPQGAARFAAWLVAAVAERSTGLVPAPLEEWVPAGWAADDRYDTPVGACAALSATAG